MNKPCKQISLWAFFFVFLLGVRAEAQTGDYPNECSENAKQLVKEAWVAQPMSARGNKAYPAKAESLYKEAIKDSPKCGSASNLLVVLLERNHDYEQANEYNERFLRLTPNDPSALDLKADLISILKQDYAHALEIRMRLLNVEGFNRTGAVFYNIAGTYSLMNKPDESLKYLGLALSIRKGWGNKSNAQVDSSFENVRKDSRFWSLVACISETAMAPCVTNLWHEWRFTY
jgi:tetratricopeptide (TPR) repeat protein